MLADAFLQGLFQVGALALDYHQGDAVDEHHYIRPAGELAVAALHLEFVAHLEHIVGRVSPVYVLQRKALGIAVYGLLQALAQGQKVIGLLAGVDQAVKGELGQFEYRPVDILLAEGVGLSPEGDGVEPGQLRREHLGEDGHAAPPPAKGQGLGGRQIFIAQVDQQMQGGDLGGG